MRWYTSKSQHPKQAQADGAREAPAIGLSVVEVAIDQTQFAVDVLHRGVFVVTGYYPGISVPVVPAEV
jgi:hypothetical protein